MAGRSFDAASKPVGRAMSEVTVASNTQVAR